MTESANFDETALSYNRVADCYESGRPNYQADIVARVFELIDASPPGHVLDLAAGTGKFTRCLIAGHRPLVAAEPVAGMVRQLRQSVAGVPAARAYAGRLPFASQSLAAITVAQAFQWFDQTDIPELARVLSPGGVLALVWNRRQPTSSWTLVSSVIDARRPGPRRTVDAPTMIIESGAFTAPETERWRWTRSLSRAELHDHVASLSWIAALDQPARAAIALDLDEAIGDVTDLTLDYESELVFARRS